MTGRNTIRNTAGRIMFATASMIRGGAERVVSILANHYAAAGWDVSILMLLHSHVGYELDPTIRIIDISNDKVNAGLRFPKLVMQGRKILKEVRPDVLVSFMDNVCLVMGFAIRGLGIRHVTSERIDPSGIRRNFALEKVLERIYASSDCCVLQTKRAWGYFPESVRSKSRIIPNPIEVSCPASGTKRPRIVTAGRLSPQKNHMMLLEAFAGFVKGHPDYTLDIYGEGALRNALEQRITSLGLAGSITLRGNAPHLHEEISDAAMFVLSSDYEGLSNALLEAMMMGLPCISTSCSGSDEAIEDGVNGLLVPVGDSDALEDAMGRLADDEGLALMLGRNAMVSAGRFKADNVIRLWTDAIEGRDGNQGGA